MGNPIAFTGVTQGGLTVKEVDGNPTVPQVKTIVVSNGTLTDNGGGVVTITTGGGGGGGMTSWTLRGNSGANQTITDADQVTFSGSGGLATVASAVDTLTVQTTGVLEDLNTLGAPTADGEVIVATGAGTFAYESGSTARTSLGIVSGRQSTVLAGGGGSVSSIVVTNSAVTASNVIVYTIEPAAGIDTPAGSGVITSRNASTSFTILVDLINTTPGDLDYAVNYIIIG